MKNLVITAKQLEAMKACEKQIRIFREKFGESVSFTSEAEAKETAAIFAAVFDFDWAAKNMLREEAWAEYERATGAALAEYERATGPALAEYERATGPAWAEYKRATGAARAEYERATGAAFASAFWKQECN